MRKYIQQLSMILLLTYLYFIVGCTYYKVTNANSIAAVEDQIKNNTRYFIVHQGPNAWHFTNIALDNDKEELSGTLEALPENHKYYLTTKPVGANRIKTKSAHGTDQRVPTNNPLYEVHFYITEYQENQDAQITIPLSSVTKVEIYDKDASANTATAVFATLGVGAGIVVIIGVIILLTKSSCPFVYTADGASWNFEGEMYGGAIYSSLERHDFMPLPGFKPSNGTYQLQISNKLLERQYTDVAELIVVDHPEGTKVLLDKNGNLQTLVHPEAPLLAVSGKNTDNTNSIVSMDSTAYLFSDENTTDNALSNLTLTFNKPSSATSGKLVVNVKNSYWLDYVYGKFNELFGTYFNTFSEAQKSVSAQKINQWSMDQGIPLAVYIETEKGWEFVDYFQVTGPLASREMVMTVDLTKVKTDKIHLKMECGFMFWELDYAAMDFSADLPVTVSHHQASSAIDEKGADVSSLLASADDKYLVQPEVGNEVTIAFPSCLPEENHLQSVFLHSKGYYEYIRDYKNIPDLIALSSFKKVGSFTRFSKKKYNEFVSKPYLFEDAISANDGN